MKTLKITSMLLLLLSFMACKKDKDQSTIQAAELLNYQLVVSLKNQTSTDVRLIYFTQQGNNVVATLEGLNLKKEQVVSIKNDGFTFNETDDATITHQFVFSKDVNGNLIYKSVSYNNKADINMSIEASYISKIPDIYDVFSTGATYDNSTGLNFGLNIEKTNNWRFSNSPTLGTYTKISAGAMKAMLDGKAYFGVSIKEKLPNGFVRTFMLMKGPTPNFYKFGLV